MSDIRPFKAFRPRPDVVQQVAAQPYDVISSEEARELAKGKPLSFLHISKSEIDLPTNIDVYSDQVYELSAKTFDKMCADGVFSQDKTPCFYVYQLKMGDHVQKGLVVGASVEEYENNKIKKHELTRRKKEDDRARHVEITRANHEPVLFTYRARNDIRDIISKVCSSSKPVYDFTTEDGIGHALWVIDNPETIKRLQEAFMKIDALYVADGHHRTASAFRVRDIMKKKNPNHTGKEEYNHFLTVLFPDDELRIMGYHRTVKDLNGLSSEEFLKKVSAKFDVQPSVQTEPSKTHEFGMYLDGKWYKLTAKKETYQGKDPVSSLDASILQDNLLAPILNILDPRTDNRIDFVGGIRGMKELERRCKKDMKVAFAVAPVTVEQLMAIADSGAIMPPKSTWFEPKLRSGLFVRTI